MRESDSDAGNDSLLKELRSARPDVAWRTFLDRHAARIMRVVRLREYDEQHASDCFMFVCEKLVDDGFRRLLQFDATRGVPFGAWLNAVVANLCVEWHREQFGRARVPASIMGLSALDRSVFEYRYRHDLDLQTCAHLLRSAYPALTRAALSASLARVHSAMTPRQRWNLVRQRGRFVPLASARMQDIPESQPNPEQLNELHQRRDRLQVALKQLPASDRFLLRLRFEENLTFEGIARLAGLNNLHQARRRIEVALSALRQLLSGDETGQSRK